jgi:hypothetical protein
VREDGGVEKLPESFYWSVPKITLYREELHELMRIFETHGTGVSITVSGYKLASSDELDAVPGEAATGFSVRSRDPDVSVNLSESGGSVQAAGSAGPAGRGIADEARALIAGHRDIWRDVAANLGLAAPALCMVALASFVIGLLAGGAATVAALLAIATIVFGLASVWSWRELNDRRVRLILKSRADAPSFLKRNGDQIVLMVASLVVGGVLTKLLGL